MQKAVKWDLITQVQLKRFEYQTSCTHTHLNGKDKKAIRTNDKFHFYCLCNCIYFYTKYILYFFGLVCHLDIQLVTQWGGGGA